MNVQNYALVLLVSMVCVVLLALSAAGCGSAAGKSSAYSGSSATQPEKEALKKERGSVRTEVVGVAESETQGKGDSVMINLGSNNGVRIGQEFVVSRGKMYICVIVIQKVYKTSAIGTVVPESVNRDKNGNPLQAEAGDAAVSK